MERPPRRLIPLAGGIVAFVAAYVLLFPSGCAAVEGVSSWERCSTLIGTPAFSLTDWGLDNKLDILMPLLVGLLAGIITWWLRAPRKGRP